MNDAFNEIVANIELELPSLNNVVLEDNSGKIVVHLGTSYNFPFPLCRTRMSLRNYTETDRLASCKKCMRFPAEMVGDSQSNRPGG